MTLYEQWLEVKNIEREAIDKRREIEDAMTKSLNVPPDFDKSTTFSDQGFKITVTGRINKSVDVSKIEEIANERGLVDHLQQLFRWKAEINAKAWNASDPSITQFFEEGITSKPGRVTYKIENMED